MIRVWQPKSKARYQKILRSFDNLIWFNAAGAYRHPAVSASREFDADRLQIRLKAPTGLIIRVWDVVSKLRPFAAYFASFCHNIKASVIKTRYKKNRVFVKLENKFYNKYSYV